MEDGQRQDWCTPEDCAPYIYETLGGIPDLDACSNPDALIQAKRVIWWDELKEQYDAEGISLAANAEYGDGLEVLRNAAPGTTVYLNPPFGREDVPKWVDACVAAYQRGVEILALLPSYTSTYWFDHVYQTAVAACFWGLPGVTNSRLRFVGAKDGAGFAVYFVYWGDHEERFTRAFARAGEIWHMRRDRLLTARICGHRIPAVTAPDAHRPSAALGDLFAHADKRLLAGRYDAIAQACTDVRDVTLADLYDSKAEHLKREIGSLTLGEVLDGLSLAASCDTAERAVRHARTGTRRDHSDERPPGTPDPQLDLSHTKKKRTKDEIAQYDAEVLDVIKRAASKGIGKSDIHAVAGGTLSNLRDTLARHRKAGTIQLEGTRNQARYTSASQPKKE